MRCLPFPIRWRRRAARHSAGGLRVPEDIAVVGFDGTELADMISLTTIEQPSRDIGRKAVDLLLNKIDNPDAPTERVMMDWRFISRAST
jgi:DNA-binding LacI/PurR family transcriptional regulator